MNTNKNISFKNGSVRKRFYHSQSDQYPEIIKEDAPAENSKKRKKKSLSYSFVVPWQMENDVY